VAARRRAAYSGSIDNPLGLAESPPKEPDMSQPRTPAATGSTATPSAAAGPSLAAAPRMTALACALLSTVALVASIGALAESRSDAALLAHQAAHQAAHQVANQAAQPGSAARV
jgi:hypothetical protein